MYVLRAYNGRSLAVSGFAGHDLPKPLSFSHTAADFIRLPHSKISEAAAGHRDSLPKASYAAGRGNVTFRLTPPGGGGHFRPNMV